MSIKMKDLPESERPYEKLELYGEQSLSNAELLAIIIKSGTKDETSVQIAQRILKLRGTYEKDNLSFLREISLEQLKQIKGIGKVKAIQIKALCEIAIRMSKPINYKDIIIKKPQDIAQMVLNELSHEKKEIAKIILLDNKNRIQKIKDISTGGANYVNVNIKDIAIEALKISATRVILIHNHPTGDSRPSTADIKFTQKLYTALELFEIDLLDHIVIGNMEYTSIYEYIEKLKRKSPKELATMLNNKDVE